MILGLHHYTKSSTVFVAITLTFDPLRPTHLMTQASWQDLRTKAAVDDHMTVGMDADDERHGLCMRHKTCQSFGADEWYIVFLPGDVLWSRSPTLQNYVPPDTSKSVPPDTLLIPLSLSLPSLTLSYIASDVPITNLKVFRSSFGTSCPLRHNATLFLLHVSYTPCFWFLFCRHALSNVVLVTVLILSHRRWQSLQDLHQMERQPFASFWAFVQAWWKANPLLHFELLYKLFVHFKKSV